MCRLLWTLGARGCARLLQLFSKSRSIHHELSTKKTRVHLRVSSGVLQQNHCTDRTLVQTSGGRRTSTRDVVERADQATGHTIVVCYMASPPRTFSNSNSPHGKECNTSSAAHPSQDEQFRSRVSPACDIECRQPREEKTRGANVC